MAKKKSTIVKTSEQLEKEKERYKQFLEEYGIFTNPSERGLKEVARLTYDLSVVRYENYVNYKIGEMDPEKYMYDNEHLKLIISLSEKIVKVKLNLVKAAPFCVSDTDMLNQVGG